MLQWSRITALFFAIGLAIGEAIINWGNWQYAPLWIVDYLCVAWLFAGFWTSRDQRSNPILISAWAFTTGVFYMALFVSLEPDLPQYHSPERMPLLYLIGVLLVLAILGVLTSFLAYRKDRLERMV